MSSCGSLRFTILFDKVDEEQLHASGTVLAGAGQQLEASVLHEIGARGIRAILLIDVVESVRLVEQDEGGFFTRWLTFVDYIRTEVLPGCEGHFVKSLGDGVLLAFDGVRQAVTAAFAIQHASHHGNQNVRPDHQILLRMGLEVSEVLLDEGDVYGRGVNRASRLLSLAGPGEIIVSANVRDQVTADLDADIEDLGDCYLRNIPTPVRAYRVGPPGPRPVIETGSVSSELLP